MACPVSQLPNAPCVQITPSISIQPPLSRRGTGPGLILIISDDVDLRGHDKTLDPPPLQKWAEESFAVGQILVGGDLSGLSEQLGRVLSELEKLPRCTSTDKVGVVAILSSPSNALTTALTAHPRIAAAVLYLPTAPSPPPAIPTLAHLPVTTPNTLTLTAYTYTPAFLPLPSAASYSASSTKLSHTRSLAFLKPRLGGPHFDLEAIWEEHTRLEFADRSVEATMATMVAEPYVNNVPTLTGGVGRAVLTNFYRGHFIFSNPDDAGMELVSRTVGIDRVVDEFVFGCTHDREIDWMIPGIPPTGKKLSVPVTSVVNIRGDRLYHEHIAWDQGTVLRQLGLLPDYLPFPYPLPDGRQSGKDGKQFEYRVPVSGAETALKLVDENGVPSNQMLGHAIREVADTSK
ncbi:hypothetical protein B0H67DRAFT_549832 [Lasiosphaeris hirsuta]|uniref:Carboxymethylenebutenolidase n=1 Tax=Lasiosphaeris hirsuta TaxID=260670 RepID=A0AA40BDG9_9PEZI|nr:hypothetical protein B0H67DRAFT_549832 [Lasiosphaeris hirsuta]